MCANLADEVEIDQLKIENIWLHDDTEHNIGSHPSSLSKGEGKQQEEDAGGGCCSTRDGRLVCVWGPHRVHVLDYAPLSTPVTNSTRAGRHSRHRHTQTRSPSLPSQPTRCALVSTLPVPHRRLTAACWLEAEEANNGSGGVDDKEDSDDTNGGGAATNAPALVPPPPLALADDRSTITILTFSKYAGVYSATVAASVVASDCPSAFNWFEGATQHTVFVGTRWESTGMGRVTSGESKKHVGISSMIACDGGLCYEGDGGESSATHSSPGASLRKRQRRQRRRLLWCVTRQHPRTLWRVDTDSLSAHPLKLPRDWGGITEKTWTGDTTLRLHSVQRAGRLGKSEPGADDMAHKLPLPPLRCGAFAVSVERASSDLVSMKSEVGGDTGDSAPSVSATAAASAVVICEPTNASSLFTLPLSSHVVRMEGACGGGLAAPTFLSVTDVVCGAPHEVLICCVTSDNSNKCFGEAAVLCYDLRRPGTPLWRHVVTSPCDQMSTARRSVAAAQQQQQQQQCWLRMTPISLYSTLVYDASSGASQLVSHDGSEAFLTWPFTPPADSSQRLCSSTLITLYKCRLFALRSGGRKRARPSEAEEDESAITPAGAAA